jgi:hypothetical protein
MKQAGHASVSTTWLYTITDDGREEEQVAKLWNKLQAK